MVGETKPLPRFVEFIHGKIFLTCSAREYLYIVFGKSFLTKHILGFPRNLFPASSRYALHVKFVDGDLA
jgi:hypothetical protein